MKNKIKQLIDKLDGWETVIPIIRIIFITLPIIYFAVFYYLLSNI